MNINASDRTLGLLNIWQVLRKLDWEVELMKSIPGKVRLGIAPDSPMQVVDAKLYAAINAASTSIALVDWLYHLAQENSAIKDRLVDFLEINDLTTVKSFRQLLRQKHVPINICHQICNANKHLSLSDYDVGLKIMVGDMIFENQDGTEDLSVVAQVVWSSGAPFQDGSVFKLIDELRSWWRQLIARLGVPDRDIFYPDFAP